ncbi:uridine kinase [Aquipuribacter hungaricus]|uniref:Uridine kinase n=1 Tax=Aquipuribacter hungaricus TaxID=545624 RepID=A0ABV7WIZ0_9MICO
MQAVTATPVSAQVLARTALQRAAGLLDVARGAGTVVRLGVDGAVDAETAALADLVASEALAAGTAVLRVRAADFLHRRSVRLEHGPADVDAAFDRWVDWGSLRREVLDPLEDPADLSWLPRLRDAATDRAARETSRTAAPGAVLVVDGPYLLRWELSGALDVAVHLQTSPAALARRFPGDDDPRPGAWARYLDETDPAARADLVVRYDHPDRPALLAGTAP